MVVVVRVETLRVVVKVVVTGGIVTVTGGEVVVTVEVTVRELLAKYPTPAARTIKTTATATRTVRPIADKFDFIIFISVL